MTLAAPTAPGLDFAVVRQAAEPSPLRTDVAGFAGRTRRGPPGLAIRVTGWREYLMMFGGALADADTPMAIQGYFDNGGDVAWIVRLPAASEGVAAATTASAIWDVTRPAPGADPWQDWTPASPRFSASRYRLEASSPGIWGNSIRFEARFRKAGVANRPEVDLLVQAEGEPDERLVGLDPARLEDEVTASSRLLRLSPLDPTQSAPSPQGPLDPTQSAPSPQGPQLLRWRPLTLGGGGEPAIAVGDYRAALTSLGDQPEVALTAFPDLLADLGSDAAALQDEAMDAAEAQHDRLVLLDLPPDADTQAALAWSTDRRSPAGDRSGRAAAAYHPPVSVADPFGGVARPLRTIAPCGHVAGLISLLDRQRGSQYTPANATLGQVADVAAGFKPAERGALNEAGINLLLCKPGQGVQVWGGRTLLARPEGRYIAHRRLIHRLVRSVRRVAEPLVFEANGPALWLALVRGATSVLLEAWRAGGLQGERAEEAFQVRCDGTNNPPEQVDAGITICEIALAPAVPMEFITLRITLGAQGSLDVFES
jgi:uncharacterized protein